MTLSLRDKLKSTDFLDVSKPPLERIGALYSAGRRIEKSDVVNQFNELLNQFELSQGKANIDELLVTLHAATQLAQAGQFSGIEFILKILIQSEQRDQLELAQKAIQNCSHFPIAALAAKLVDLKQARDFLSDHGDVLRQSADELTEQSRNQNLTQVINRLKGTLDSLNQFPTRSNFRLSLGTILSRPIQKEDLLYRYTGFVMVNDEGIPPLIVSYDMGNVINRNESRGREDVFQQLRQPGSYALILYQTEAPFEIEELYVLPFSRKRYEQISIDLSEIVTTCRGLDIGVLNKTKLGRDKDRYQIITRNGQAESSNWRSNQKSIGDISFFHAENSQSLSSRFSVSPEIIPQLEELFSQNTK